MSEKLMEMRERIEIEDHPYDLGYWARYFDIPLHAGAEAEWENGWRACDRELLEAADPLNAPEPPHGR